MNSQLEKQIIMLRDKLEKLKIPSQDGKSFNACDISKLLWNPDILYAKGAVQYYYFMLYRAIVLSKLQT